MSLDVYLKSDRLMPKPRGSGIFIRWEGSTREISRAVWDELNPGREPVAFLSQKTETDILWEANITHNLTTMAEAAGLYMPLWRPEEIGISHACQLIDPLEAGLARLKGNPLTYKQFTPDNGWGDFNILVAFVAAYLAACKAHPEARVEVDR